MRRVFSVVGFHSAPLATPSRAARLRTQRRSKQPAATKSQAFPSMNNVDDLMSSPQHSTTYHAASDQSFLQPGSPTTPPPPPNTMESIRSEILLFQQNKRQEAYLKEALRRQKESANDVVSGGAPNSTTTSSSVTSNASRQGELRGKVSDVLPHSAVFSPTSRTAHTILRDVQQLQQEEEQFFEREWARDAKEVLRGPGLSSAQSASAPTSDRHDGLKLLSMGIPLQHWGPLKQARHDAMQQFQVAVRKHLAQQPQLPPSMAKALREDKPLSAAELPSDILLNVLSEATEEQLRVWLRCGVVDPMMLLPEGTGEASEEQPPTEHAVEKDQPQQTETKTASEDVEKGDDDDDALTFDSVAAAGQLEKLTNAVLHAPLDPTASAALDALVQQHQKKKRLSKNAADFLAAKQQQRRDGASSAAQQLDEALRSPSPVLTAVSTIDAKFATALHTLNRIRRTLMVDPAFTEALALSDAQDRQARKRFLALKTEEKQRKARETQRNLTMRRAEGAIEGSSVATPRFFGSVHSRPPPSAEMHSPLPKRFGKRKRNRTGQKRYSQ